MKRRLRHDRRAATMLEFAIIAVPFLLLSLGTIEFGRAIWTREVLQVAAFQGARCMGVRASACSSNGAYDSGNTTSYIQSVATGWGVTLTSDQLTLNSNATSGNCSGVTGSGLSEVTIRYTFQTVVPGLLTMLSGGAAMRGHACFPNQS